MKEYSYSGEYEPTICPCGAIHPWTYELSKCSCGAEGCYECQEKCAFCYENFCAGELVRYQDSKVCAKCKAINMEIDREERALEQLILDLAA